MNALQLWPRLDAVGYGAMRLLAGALWQSSILLLAIAALTWLLRRRRATVRHALWVAGLVAAPLLPLIAGAAVRSGAPQAPVQILPAYAQTVVVGVEAPAIAFEPEPFPVEHEAAPQRPPDAEQRLYPWAMLLLAYAVGLTGFLAWIGVGRTRIRRWIRSGAPVLEGRALSTFRAAKETVGLGRGFLVLEGDGVPAPISYGLIHQVVLLPKGLAEQLSDAELRALAVHELTHLKRNDGLVLHLVALVRAVLFFHPLVWLACRQVSDLAEAACDDAVLDAGAAPVSYAKMLTRLAEELPRRSVTTELAAGIVLSKGAFLRRVQAILSDRRDRIRKLTRWAFAATLLGAVVSLGIALALPLGEKAAKAPDYEALMKEHHEEIKAAAEAYARDHEGKWPRTPEDLLSYVRDEELAEKLRPALGRAQIEARKAVLRQRLHGLGLALAMHRRRPDGYPKALKELEELGYLGEGNPLASFSVGEQKVQYVIPKSDDPNEALLYHWPPFVGGTWLLYQNLELDWIEYVADGSLTNPRTGAVIRPVDTRPAQTAPGPTAGRVEEAPAGHAGGGTVESGVLLREWHWMVEDLAAAAHAEGRTLPEEKRGPGWRARLEDSARELGAFQVTADEEAALAAGRFDDEENDRRFRSAVRTCERLDRGLSPAALVAGYSVEEGQTKGVRLELVRRVFEAEARRAARDSVRPVKGTVRAPDGTALSDAEVILLEPSYTADIPDGRFRALTLNSGGREKPGVTGTTDAEGGFILPAESDRYVVWVMHDRGYADVTADELSASSEIQVVPWERLEGELLAGDKPVPGQGITLMVSGNYDPAGLRSREWVSDDGMSVSHRRETRTDQEGRFVFERIPAGTARLGRFFTTGRGTSTFLSLSGTTEVTRGKTARVTLGGEGRPVIGRVVQPTGKAMPLDWQNVRGWLELAAPSMSMMPMEGGGDRGPWAAYAAFKKSDEGKRYRRDAFDLADDRSFRVEGVPAGEYVLQILAYGSEAAGQPPGTPVMRAGKRVTVPLMPGGRSEKPLDIGMLELRLPTVGRDGVADETAERWAVRESHKAVRRAVEPPTREAGEGMQVRFWPQRTLWRPGETPALRAEMDNRGRRRLLVPHSEQLCELEFDGQWYRRADADGTAGERVRVVPGSSYGGVTFTLTADWQRKGDGRPLSLSEGTHTVRVAFPCDPADDGAPLRVESLPAEIHIRPEAPPEPGENDPERFQREMALAEQATDAETKVEHLRNALHCRPDDPENIAIEYQIAVSIRGSVVAPRHEGDKLHEAHEIHAGIIRRYNHMDYYTRQGANSPWDPEVLVPYSAHAAAFTCCDPAATAAFFRTAMACLRQTHDRRTKDWLDEPEPEQHAMFDDRGKWEGRVARWRECRELAAAGTVLTPVELGIAYMCILGHVERAEPEHAADAMQEILRDFPLQEAAAALRMLVQEFGPHNAPMAALATAQLERLGGGDAQLDYNALAEQYRDEIGAAFEAFRRDNPVTP